jgi:hypothetical protein
MSTKNEDKFLLAFKVKATILESRKLYHERDPTQSKLKGTHCCHSVRTTHTTQHALPLCNMLLSIDLSVLMGQKNLDAYAKVRVMYATQEHVVLTWAQLLGPSMDHVVPRLQHRRHHHHSRAQDHCGQVLGLAYLHQQVSHNSMATKTNKKTLVLFLRHLCNMNKKEMFELS